MAAPSTYVWNAVAGFPLVVTRQLTLNFRQSTDLCFFRARGPDVRREVGVVWRRTVYEVEWGTDAPILSTPVIALAINTNTLCPQLDCLASTTDFALARSHHSAPPSTVGPVEYPDSPLSHAQAEAKRTAETARKKTTHFIVIT